MSKNTSPQSRPTRRPRTAGPSRSRAAAKAHAAERGKTEASSRRAEKPRPTTLTGRLRRFLPVIAVPELLVVLVLVVISLAGIMFASGTMGALPATIATAWMALNLAPVVLSDVTVSLLPLLPAIGLVALIAHRVRRAVRTKVSVIDLAVLLACTLLVPVILTLVAWVMLWDAAKVFDLSPPPVWEALARTVLVHLAAYVLGLGRKLWRAVARHYRLPSELVDGAVDAGFFFRRMAVVSLPVLAGLLLFGWGRQVQMAESFDSFGGGELMGLLLTSLLYLPNAMIATVAVLLGGEFVAGEASVSLFSVHLVPLPPMPLFALIPGEVSQWAPVLLLIAGALASWQAARSRPGLVQAVGAGLSATLTGAAAAYLAGGELGWYGHTGPTVWLAALLAGAWVGVIGVGTSLILGLLERRTTVLDAEPVEEEVEEQVEEQEPQEETAEEAEEAEEVEEVEEAEETPEAEPEEEPQEEETDEVENDVASKDEEVEDNAEDAEDEGVAEDERR